MIIYNNYYGTYLPIVCCLFPGLWGEGICGFCRMCVGSSPASGTTLKKGLVPYLSGGGTENIYKIMGQRESVNIVAERQNSNIVVSKFELQSHNCIHFWTNTHGKGMDSLAIQLWVK